MSELAAILQLMLLPHLVCLLLTLVGMLSAQRYANRGRVRPARIWSLIAGISGIFAVLVYIAEFVLAQDACGGIMIAMWGYITYMMWDLYFQLKNR